MGRKKVLLIGLGSIGTRYKRLLLERGDIDVLALRSGLNPSVPGIMEVRSWKEVEAAAPDMAFVTNPTAFHIETAIKCAELGLHLFIEKPLDMRLRGIDRLMGILRKKKLSLYVAYNLRFHPGIMKLRAIVNKEGFCHASVRCSSWLPDWRPGTDYRKSYSGNAQLGGGVVLDLSHDVDYSSYLFGDVSSISGVARRSSGVTKDAEDVADMNLHLKKGGHVAVHVDFCGRFVERVIKVSTPRASYTLDLIAGELVRSCNGRTTKSGCYVERDYTYRAEIAYFLKNIGGTMMNNVKEASHLLAELVKFKRANGL